MSDKTLDKLIATLKSDAIDAADNASKKIVEEAHIRAQEIVKNAEEKRERILMDAEKEAQATISKGESALRQAARDFTVSVQNDLLKLFEVLLEREIRTAFTPDLIKSAILKVIENVGGEVELKLPADVEQDLADHIQQRLQTSNDLVSITKDEHMLHGFSIVKTAQGWSYHISPEEVAELLNTHLGKRWSYILKNGAQV
ncbi:MAG: hypothetical protein WBG90_06865 [Saonia sp.]